MSPHTTSVEIAFFGGSFTAIPREYMIELLSSVQTFLSNDRVTGIRISTRPDAIDVEILDILQQYGVTSIELGAQSMDDSVLCQNMRGHTVQDVINASILIKEYGFSLGLQMMTGLYGATEESDYQTAVALVALEPNTVRIYPTVVLADTYLATLTQNGSYSAPNVEQTVPRCVKIIDLFEKNQIQIIRLGLHASTTMEQKMIGGCYHPAFGELCKGERYYQQISRELEALGGDIFDLVIDDKKVSQILGQKRKNIIRLRTKGYQISYRISKEDIFGDYILTKKRNGAD